MRTESTLLAWSDVSPADDGTTIADLFRVLRRRRRTIVLVTVLLTGATAAFASQLDARYSAVASIVIAPYESKILAVDAVRPSSYIDRGPLEIPRPPPHPTHLTLTTTNTSTMYRD